MKVNIRTYFAVGIGGMIGAALRYSLSLLCLSTGLFPYGTLVANLIGCFFLSYLMFHDLIKNKLPPDMFAALTAGVIGSFTTFSTFAAETITLWHSHYYLAIIYIFLSVLMGLAFCFGGYSLASRKKG